MDKNQPHSYSGEPSAPATIYTQEGGYPLPQGTYGQSGLQQPGAGYPLQSVYQPQPPQSEYPPQYEFAPPPAYAPQSEYPPQSGYQPQSGYPPRSAYPPLSGFQPPSGLQPEPVNPRQPIYVPKKIGYCEDMHRSKPQSNSLAAAYSEEISRILQGDYHILPMIISGDFNINFATPEAQPFIDFMQDKFAQVTKPSQATLIFISGGMSFADSVGFSNITYEYVSESAYTHLQICWFVAVIIGAFLSAILVEKLPKRVFNFFSSILVIVNGTLFVACSHSFAAIVIARYCDGIAFGFCLIPAIVAGSEQAVKRFRGLVLSSEQIGLTTGILLKVIYGNFWDYNWSLNSNQMHGILTLVYGVLAFLLTFVLTIESPVFYLRKHNEAEAINSLNRLHKAATDNNETYALLYENKHLLDEDLARGGAENISNGLVPVIKLCILRAFVAMSFTLPLTWGLLAASTLNGSDWCPYVYAVARMVGVFIPVFTLDTLGRRVLSALSLLVGGGLLIGIGSLFSNNLWSLINSNDLDLVIILLIIYQLFAGIVAPAVTCYLGEAFSISVKPYFILVVVIFENIIQIIVCCSFDNTLESMSDFGYALGALQIVYAIVFYAVMPETKQTTLREALAKFKKTMSI